VDHPVRTLLYELFLEPIRRWPKRPLERLPGLRYPFSVLLAILSVLCTHLLQAQQMPPLEKGPVPLFARAPKLVGPVPGAETRVRPLPVLPQTFEANKGQTESQVRVPPLPASYYRIPTTNRNRALLELQPRTGAAEAPDKGKDFTSSASREWVAPLFANAPPTPVHRGNDLQHRIPGAGPIILRVSRQAQAHPHITGVLKLFSPQF
jgi:hypothetical protein